MSAADPIDPPVQHDRRPSAVPPDPMPVPRPEVADTVEAPSAPDTVRASNAEREDTVAALHRALGEGRLDLAETENRQSAAYAARYRHELPGLLADLPGLAGSAHVGAGTLGPSWADLFEALVWRLRAVVFGADVGRPTPAQRAWAAAAMATVMVWTLLWALVAAVAVGA